MNYQRRLERDSILILMVTMALSAWSFMASPNTTVFHRFSEDLGITVTPEFFAVGCLFGVFAAPSLALVPRIKRIASKWKRLIYVFCAFPLLAYCIPVGWVAYRDHSPGLGAVVYLLTFGWAVTAARGLYRDT